jgi:class 3 adenylate cyclase
MNVVTLLTASEVALTANGTFLFTDIVSSTAMAESVGDERWARVLRAHNSIIRAAVQIHRGEECAFLGDGFLVLFANADDAYDCAIAIQEALSNFGAAFPDAPLRVRIGLHCGTACREGRDVFGRTVHMASRVASEADGGEILLSACAQEQLRHALPRFTRAREVALKGMDGTHTVFSVRPPRPAAAIA